MRGLLARSSQFLLGLLVSSVAYGFTVHAALGLGPLFLVQQGLERHLQLSAGSAATVLGLAVVAASAALRGGVGPGTVLGPILGGWMIDATLPSLPTPEGLVLRGAVCVGATVVMMLGAVLITRARLGTNALDGVMGALSRASGRPTSHVRLVMEAAMLALGMALGSAVGVGTVLTAVLVGHSYQFWMRLLGEPATDTDGSERRTAWTSPAHAWSRWRPTWSPNRTSSTGSSPG